ncbi:F0F1 ATP synthase subunit gamma [Actinospica sp.]|uniref:F0F1 ATP synthase subunit gamma n=1 Tax=Actinospica sp. TaxID=1872142 RepID=UPI002C3F66FE|nr:F0F1 ATP synthase subunit gamma [Actinospica sp.]HWG23651.1 F0F1 ATP synthase subunit gamma [Actinospica sp.]
MGAQLRAVRRRIRTVQSTAKITRAQELIASSRIIRAQQRVREAAPYSRELTRAVEAVVSGSRQVDHPLITEPKEPSRAAVVIITSDRGFAGGYNANVLREAQSLAATLSGRGVEALPYVAGRKGIVWHRFRQREIAAEWSGFSEAPQFSDASEMAARLLEDFTADEGGLDEIYLVYTEFVSMLTQQPAVRRILPLEIEETTEQPPEGPLPLYEFEPSPEAVLDALLPWYIENRLYQALLESAAAEIASRRRAMKSATDNARDLIDALTLEANKARQAEITQEISEIVGGANALSEELAGSE